MFRFRIKYDSHVQGRFSITRLAALFEVTEGLWHCDRVCEALIVYQHFIDVVVLSVCIVDECDDGEDDP